MCRGFGRQALGRLWLDRGPQLDRVHGDDLGQVVGVVKLEVLVHVEPFAQGAGEHPATGRGPDDRELLERQIDGPRRHPLAQDHVDAEIFHDRIDELLDGLGQAVNLVNEQDRPFGRIGQIGHHVHLLVERRAAGHVQLDAQLVVQHGGERGLAQPGRAVKENVRQRLAPLAGGQKRDRQPLGDGTLANDLAQPLRTKLLIGGIDGSRPPRLVRGSPQPARRPRRCRLGSP